MLDLESLKSEYDGIVPDAERFATTLRHQIDTVASDNSISLGVPLESRVKQWASITSKLERKHATIDSILKLDDFVGVRVILLFTRDLELMHKALGECFRILSYEDTATRLEETQFGYQSVHYIVSLPTEWLSVPTMATFAGFKAEIQVRTLAQHIWAAASHKLQYKQESSVPLQLRRSIHRVSAILETVDLEFERLLDERHTYVENIKEDRNEQALNVEVLRAILEEEWPEDNFDEEDSYANLLDDLTEFGVQTSADLRTLIEEQRDGVMTAERDMVKEAQQELGQYGEAFGTDEERTNRGVFFSHVGLTRQALECRSPNSWLSYQRKKLTEQVTEEID